MASANNSINQTRLIEVMKSAGFHMKESWIIQVRLFRTLALQHCALKEVNRYFQAIDRLQQRDIENELYQSALYSDFRQTGSGCLPPNLITCICCKVSGKFVLQVLPLVR